MGGGFRTVRDQGRARTRDGLMGRKVAATKKRAGSPRVNQGKIAMPWPFRQYQQERIDRFDAGRRRQMLIWHRRAGKDIFGLSLARREAQINVGGYWHFFPKHVQARRAIWNGVDPKLGRNFVDAAFGDIICNKNNTEMFLEFNSGSTWQLLGSDNYDRLVGGNARGVVFSEWALCDPQAWNYIRPIILENKGWALFITTYRGRNHAWRMAQSLKSNPEWDVDVRTVLDTHDLNGERIITDEDIDKERAEGTSEAIIQQEYFCNPAATVAGAVYGMSTERLRASAARMAARWRPLAPVFACWDFSQSPTSTALLHVQPTGSTRLQVIAAESIQGASVPDCLAIANQRPWKISEHLISEESEPLVSIMADLRVFPTVIKSSAHVETVTQAAIETLEVDGAECEALLDSLSGYTRSDMSEDELHPVFSEDYAMTWHVPMTHAFELAALHEYEGGSDWSKPQTYRNFDRRIV
jgi:hypothetical protein